MPTDLSLLPPHAQCLHIYRRLKQDKELFKRTPIVFCEGDSWFSTPLAMNILDWLVFPTPEEEERGVPLVGAAACSTATRRAEASPPRCSRVRA